MWQVENRTPFAVERGWVRDRDGAEVWLVAAKCTFDVKDDGSTEVAAVQPPVLRAPEYNGEPGESSVKYEADLVLTKRTTDVIVVGQAYAPGGRLVTALDVGVRVGPMQKVLRVTGDRRWRAFGHSSPEPFVTMPIVYERAFGGVDRRSSHPERDWEWRNPVGTGFAVTHDNAAGITLPNIEYPDELVRSWKDRPRPAGFGAVGCHWRPRAEFAGTYDAQWLRERQPLLPADFDDRFFQYAPQDQQPAAFLRGGEPVVLVGLTPAGDLRFRLPEVALLLVTRFYDGTSQVHAEPRLHSVILEPDYPRVSLVWHSALPCHFKVQKLKDTIVCLAADGNVPDLTDPEIDELEAA